MREKDSVKGSHKDYFFIAIALVIVCGLILALVANSTPSETNNSTDQNNSDQNTPISPAPDDQNSQTEPQPQPTKWCYKYFLHRRPVININVEEAGQFFKISWQEAEELGYLIQGQEIYMENLDLNGTYCQGGVYYGWKKPYRDICLALEDEDKIEECLDSSIDDLGNFLGDINSSN